MKVKEIKLDDNGEPSHVTAEMTTNEAAMIISLVGCISPLLISETYGADRWVDAVEGIYDALAGSFFNRFWDAGQDEVIPRKKLKVVAYDD